METFGVVGSYLGILVLALLLLLRLLLFLGGPCRHFLSGVRSRCGGLLRNRLLGFLVVGRAKLRVVRILGLLPGGVLV